VKAIEVARRQGARSLELQAAVSVSRVWQEHGREADARRTLVDACGGFTEGLDTVDLREAQALLNAMPAPEALYSLEGPRAAAAEELGAAHSAVLNPLSD